MLRIDRLHPDSRNHVLIDRRFGLIREWQETDAAACEGARLREGLLDKTNTASQVWADTACRSKAGEAFMEEHGFVSRVPRKKPKGRPMPGRTRIANGARSKVRAFVEHVFAEEKSRMGLVVRTIGIVRAITKIAMANIACTIKRLISRQKPAAASRTRSGSSRISSTPPASPCSKTSTDVRTGRPRLEYRGQVALIEPSSLPQSASGCTVMGRSPGHPQRLTPTPGSIPGGNHLELNRFRQSTHQRSQVVHYARDMQAQRFRCFFVLLCHQKFEYLQVFFGLMIVTRSIHHGLICQ